MPGLAGAAARAPPDAAVAHVECARADGGPSHAATFDRTHETPDDATDAN